MSWVVVRSFWRYSDLEMIHYKNHENEYSVKLLRLVPQSTTVVFRLPDVLMEVFRMKGLSIFR